MLYVLDGPPMLYARPFLNVVNNLINDKKIEPIVIVFIGVEDRWTEYVSESPEYAKLVTGELVPFIEKNFQVSSVSRQTRHHRRLGVRAMPPLLPP